MHAEVFGVKSTGAWASLWNASKTEWIEMDRRMDKIDGWIKQIQQNVICIM